MNRSTIITTFFLLIALPLSAPALTQPETATNVEQETFELDGTTYIIPPPWAGKRIHAPSPAAIKFGLIPPEHAHNGGSIYVQEKTRDALVRMMDAAEEDGIMLVVHSGFRSYQFQKKIFTRLMREGRDYDDMVRYVAPPGYSQHALGTAVDFYPSNWEFADLPAYAWLKKNGEQFGFSESFPEHNPVGYPWEAWHWNYNGRQAD